MIFDIRSFLRSVAFFLKTLAYKLCEIADAFVSVRFVIIARIVAKVIVEIKSRNRLSFIVFVR